MNAKNIVPSIIIAGFAAALTTTAIKARNDHPTRTQHDVLILQGQGFQWQFTGNLTNNETYYQWGGVALYNADGSSGAPRYNFPASEYGQNYSTNRLAQETANALDAGFRIQSIVGDSYSTTITLVRER